MKDILSLRKAFGCWTFKQGLEVKDKGTFDVKLNEFCKINFEILFKLECYEVFAEELGVRRSFYLCTHRCVYKFYILL